MDRKRAIESLGREGVMRYKVVAVFAGALLVAGLIAGPVVTRRAAAQASPTPTFTVVVGDPSGVFSNDGWQPNTPLTITVNGSPAAPGATTDGNGGFQISPFVVNPGDHVVVSDGTTTRTHDVTSVMVTEVNFADAPVDPSTVKGTAEPDTAVHVMVAVGWPNCGPSCAEQADRYVTADPVTGEWTADFKVAGTGGLPGEEATHNITSQSGGFASQVDGEGNSTWDMFLPTPPPGPSLTPMPDINLVDGQHVALTGSNWPAGQTLYVTECRLDMPLGLDTCDATTQQTYTVEPTGTLPAGSTYTVAQSIATGSGAVDCAANPVGGCGLVGIVWSGAVGTSPPAAIDFPNNNRIHFRGPWSITVTPDTDLGDGQTVTVSGTNWPAGIGTSFEQCKPTFAGDYAHLEDDCMWLPDGAGTIVGPDGTFSVQIPVHQVITTGTGQPFDCAPDGCLIHANSQFGPLVNAVSPVITFSVANPPPSKDDCKQGGWQSFTDDEGTPFKSQGDCVSFVTTGGKNKANG